MMMARSGAFTALPGWGSVAMGATACMAAVLAWQQASEGAWLLVWLLEAAVAVTVGVSTLVRKAQASGLPLLEGPGRKYLLALLPPLGAGAVLTLALWQAGQVALLPGAWLLLYGAGTVTGGVFSVPLVPAIGAGFMVLGAVALFLPFGPANVLLGAGFGGLHLLSGWIIIKRYGG